MKRRKLLLLILLALTVIPMACDEKESPIGLGLQDPATLYNGIKDTVYFAAHTFLDDSMVTSSYTSPVIGSFRDQVFGSVHGEFFTQIGMSDDNGVIFDQHCTIDSALLTLVVSEVYPLQDRRSQPIHFKVEQTLSTIPSDSTFYYYDQLPLSRNCFFDGLSSVRVADSTRQVALKLNDNALNLFRNQSYQNSEAFIKASKGIRISIVEGNTPVMLTINLAAAKTKLTVFYRYIKGSDIGDTVAQTKDFVIGSSVSHFNHLSHRYVGPLAIFNNSHSDSVSGTNHLFFDPLAGTYVKLDYNDFLADFHRQHPYAIIHYAEIILPVSPISDLNLPSKIIARTSRNEGDYFEDMLDAFNYAGFDGAYNRSNNAYRLRITQHFQKAVSKGFDQGTFLSLNTRRYSPKRVVINGTAQPNPCRIEFVYTELDNQ